MSNVWRLTFASLFCLGLPYAALSDMIGVQTKGAAARRPLQFEGRSLQQSSTGSTISQAELWAELQLAVPDGAEWV